MAVNKADQNTELKGRKPVLLQLLPLPQKVLKNNQTKS
jgi:hypothetical protein